MIRRLVSLLCVLSAAACAPAPAVGPADVSKGPPAGLDLPSTLPPVQGFPSLRAAAPQRGNAEMARDFLDLNFRMESGRSLPALTRFEGPVTVALTGNVPATASADLDLLLARFRDEAGLDIRRVGSGPASITVAFHTKEELQRLVPAAACFVVPNVGSLGEYRRARGSGRVDWARLQTRERVTIFVPWDTSPQEVRDCLHEETAQALGPLNDLYRLPDSVFNDDNFHTVLTGFDMLVLRLQYAPQLASGMSEAEVAARLPGLLAAMNPTGEGRGLSTPPDTPRAWIDAVETAFGSRAPLAQRQKAAEQAVAIARAQGWSDSRMAFSWFVLGRLTTGSDAEGAATAFRQARAIYVTLPGGAIHAAHVDMQLAAFALSQGDAATALAVTDRAIPVVRGAQNAALLATLLQVRAEALEGLGRPAEAQATRLESLGWARYGFGPEVQVVARMADIAALAASGRDG